MDRGGQEWCTGPAGDRRAYRVAAPTPLPGGQGDVFRAVGPGGRDVALKITEGVSADAEAKLRERAAALAAHPHPRIAATIEVFRGPGLFRDEPPPDDECDLLVVVSPWAEGRSLRALGALAPAEAIEVIADVVDAVAHLHRTCGFVHRDLHPGNVIVGADGRATVIDLGAARPSFVEGDDRHTTTVAGVLGFIAPERTHGPGDERTDRWGVGMLTVFALLGQPRGERSAAALRADLRRAVAGTRRPARAAALVAQLVDPDPDARPADLARWVADLRAALAPAPERAWRWAVTVGAVAAAVATTVAVLFVALRSGSPAAVATTTTEPGCSGEFASAGLEAAAGEACAAGPAEAFADALVQPVTGAFDGVVVAGPDHPGVRLTDAQWASYESIGEGAAVFGGYPVEVRDDEVPGGIVVQLSHSGILLGRRDDSPSYWIPEQAHHVWRSNGGAAGPLGFPMTNPFFFAGGIRHEFEGGYFEVAAERFPYDALDPAVIQVHLVEDRTAPLRDLGDVAGQIVRQHIGVEWYVDGEGRRRWIPDGETLACLGGPANVAADDVPGWAAATLPLGPPATCD